MTRFGFVLSLLTVMALAPALPGCRDLDQPIESHFVKPPQVSKSKLRNVKPLDREHMEQVYNFLVDQRDLVVEEANEILAMKEAGDEQYDPRRKLFREKGIDLSRRLKAQRDRVGLDFRELPPDHPGYSLKQGLKMLNILRKHYERMMWFGDEYDPSIAARLDERLAEYKERMKTFSEE